MIKVTSMKGQLKLGVVYVGKDELTAPRRVISEGRRADKTRNVTYVDLWLCRSRTILRATFMVWAAREATQADLDRPPVERKHSQVRPPDAMRRRDDSLEVGQMWYGSERNRTRRIVALSNSHVSFVTIRQSGLKSPLGVLRVSRAVFASWATFDDTKLTG